MGNHSGYTQLFTMLETELTNTFVIEDKKVIPNRWIQLINKLSSTKNIDAFNEKRIEKEVRKSVVENDITLVHFAYLEENFWFKRYQKLKLSFPNVKFMATAHQPPSWWKINFDPNLVKDLDGLIVMSQEQKVFFEKYLSSKVFFVPHGVDYDFFRPKRDKKKNNTIFKCLFVGHWLRDVETLIKVIQLINQAKNDISFDIVYSHPKRSINYDLYHIAKFDNVNFYSNLSDIELRDLYQGADLLFLPLLDCAANNAIVEAIATGLPILSTDVKGIKSYVEESFSKLVRPYDYKEMAGYILKYSENREVLSVMSANARNYAKVNLGWDKLARETANVYHSIY